MINPELLDIILLEWSYRLKDGIPDMNDPEKIQILNQILSENQMPLVESAFDATDIAKPKYYAAWIEKIETKQPFEIEGETTKITIDPKSPFYKEFKNTKGSADKLNKLFKHPGGSKYANVIPGSDGEMYPLSKISKKPFTQKTTESGLSDLNTPDAKEGMVAFFYMCSDAELSKVSDKILLKTPNVVLKLNSSIISDKVLGSKSKKIIDSAVDFLNKTPLDKKIHEKEINYFLNAYSAAITIQKRWGTGYIIDRGELFNDIRKVGSTLSGIEPDKWCPGDVYLYKDASKIIKIKNSAEKSKLLVSIKEGGKEIIGLNSIFESKNPIAIAVSLKEAEALAGGATSFLSSKIIKGSQIKSDSRFDPEEKKLILNLATAEKNKKTIKNINALILKYEKDHIKLRLSLEKSIKSKAKIKNVAITSAASKEQSKNKQLYNLIKKNIGYEEMTKFFSNFDKLKTINPIMEQYENPLTALTAYGVSLSGFNPTFFKVVANSKGGLGHVDIFQGRDTLDMATDTVNINDAPTKAGYKIQFLTKMGEKMYKTTLDVRFKGEFEFTVTVEDFKEGV